MAFTDLVGGYLQNRMDQATQPFTDPAGYMQNRLDTAFPGTETEEDRRKRLAKEAADRANAEVQTQTVKTYADGSREQTVTQQIPPQQPAPAPQQPAPVQQAPQPVAPVTPPAQPQSTFNRMIQAESGGQQYNSQGGVLTSPAGAQGMAQIMPATAANPGFGVAPATPQEIATPEGNRAFGERYYQGLLKHFGGDETKAIAAYNAGPGRVQQNIQANGGQLNVAQLPQETQGYLKKVQGPAVPGQPGTQPMIAGNVSSDVGLTPTEQAIKQQNAGVATYYERFDRDRNNPTALYALSQDKNAPADVRKAALDEHLHQLTTVKRESEAQDRADRALASGNTSDFAKMMTSKGEEGSYIKAYLFSRLGLNELAKEEQMKIAGPKFTPQVDATGARAMIAYDPNNVPVKGYAEDGRALSKDELAKFGAGGVGLAKAETGAQIYYNPNQPTGARFAYTRTPQGGYFTEVGTQRRATPQEAATLTPMGVAGPLEQQAATAYARSGYGQLGRQAAEENAPQGALPAMPGRAPVPGAPSAPSVQGATTVAPAGAPAIPNPLQPVAVEGAPGSYAERKIGRAVAEKRTESFNKVIDTEYRENAQKGDIISNNRKSQFTILDRVDPATGKKMGEIITGIYNADNEHPGDQKWTMVRDALTSKIALPPDEISQRIARLNLSPEAKSALTEYVALNAQIAGQTLRETAGPGSVSDAEQQANRARNVDIGKTPMLGTYNMMAQSQFSGDLQRYKADLAASEHNRAANATQFDRDFRKTQNELVTAYRTMAEKRLDYITANGSTPQAIREGYKQFPVPEYDPGTGQWKKLKPLSDILGPR